jgi:hypothetical protein
MRSMGETVCIAPDQVDEILPYVLPFIKAAVERCGDWALHDVIYQLQGAQALLWVIWDGERFTAAAVSQLIKVPRGKLCQIIACGGTAESWPQALLPIEAYAKAEGCSQMRIQGRAGWSRVFPAYKTEWLSMEKELT